MNKKVLLILLILLIIFIVGAGVVSYFWYQSNLDKQKLDLYGISDVWKTFSSQGIEFQYPEKLTTQYIYTQEWPPTVKVESGNFSCKESPDLNSSTERVTQRVIGNSIYCVYVKDEGAAGSVYSAYTYTTSKNDKLVSISFTLCYLACGNYDKEQNQACTSEREAFDLDAIVNRIVETVKWD